MIPSNLYHYFETSGISISEADRQYNLLVNGANFSVLIKPATVGDGILQFSVEEIKNLSRIYLNVKDTSIQKFVPASGAATRMFKSLVEFINTGISSAPVQELRKNISELAFYNLIPESISKEEAITYIISTLHYNETPKGLIPFHKYGSKRRTAFEEHWVEAILYANREGTSNIHFTVSENHQATFEQIENNGIDLFTSENSTQLNISYSNQLASTNTLCVDNDNNVVITEGRPLLRPGGHGALIQNLQELDTDLVFIKNIDNVVHQNHIGETVMYKQALAGKLLQVKEIIFNWLKAIDEGNVNLQGLETTAKEVFIASPSNYSTWKNPAKVNYWKTKFNRPIRICGMVKNEGEPGGGPFWVESAKGPSLQIVESAQIDRNDNHQESILQQSTHFNPVDLVCYLTNYQGNRFNLLNYIDDSAAFISTKSVEGKNIKILERPGLWNGAMADWITLFVEVPTGTFNPVKTVNDLLKPMHIS